MYYLIYIARFILEKKINVLGVRLLLPLLRKGRSKGRSKEKKQKLFFTFHYKGLLEYIYNKYIAPKKKTAER
jgi:hypothetical protein